MKWEKFYKKIQNNRKNVKFQEMVNFLGFLNFKRISKGTNHEIYKREGIAEKVNIQDKNGEVKPYQMEQVINLIDKYKLM